jgi:hypothetical protein
MDGAACLRWHRAAWKSRQIKDRILRYLFWLGAAVRRGAQLGCLDLMDRRASCIPLYRRPTNETKPLLVTHESKDPRLLANGTRFNISDSLLAYLTRMGKVADAPNVFYHTLAIRHAPAYRAENSGALRQDWPRIPFPDTTEALLASAALGKQIAALLDPETPFAVAAGLSRQIPDGGVKPPLHEPPVGTPALQKIAPSLCHMGRRSKRRSTLPLPPVGDTQVRAASPCRAKGRSLSGITPRPSALL